MHAHHRYRYHRRKFAKKIDGTITPSVERHLSHAANYEQILEAVGHLVLLGHVFDVAAVEALRAQQAISLMRATIEAGRSDGLPIRKRERRA
jgi:hypothetical protein